jgi:hypothetical protein
MAPRGGNDIFLFQGKPISLGVEEIALVIKGRRVDS